MSASRYWHTLRHLRLSQFTARVAFRLRRPSPDLRTAPAVRAVTGRWAAPDWREPALTGPAAVTFLNVAASIADPAVWQDRRHEHLWLYNLHYFDDLTARDASRRREWHDPLIARWIRENPPAEGVGWSPYPTALRMANWIKWLLRDSGPGQPVPGMLDSLAVQARWLSRRLEFHLLGNHLWANAKGLLLAGLYFEGAEAEGWRTRALGIMARELDEQVLPDGGHFERSPMYHAIILEDVLDLLQLARMYGELVPAAFAGRLGAAAARMLRWLRVMTHPDGEIAFFNDAAIGIAANCRELETYARAIGIAVDERPLAPVEWLRESGYVRLTNARASVFCDVAPVGPDYQPAHAHADTLSFELSVDGRRVVVNAGTSTYEPGAERLRQRATRSHSTVDVDGLDSTEVWSGFRVARRAKPFDVSAGMQGDEARAEGAHDGYRRRPGAVHRRVWRLASDRLTIEDAVTGRFSSAVARFLLHPDAAVRSHGVQVTFAPDAQVRQVASQWHPRFGESHASSMFEMTLGAGRGVTTVRWA